MDHLFVVLLGADRSLAGENLLHGAHGPESRILDGIGRAPDRVSHSANHSANLLPGRGMLQAGPRFLNWHLCHLERHHHRSVLGGNMDHPHPRTHVIVKLQHPHRHARHIVRAEFVIHPAKPDLPFPRLPVGGFKSLVGIRVQPGDHHRRQRPRAGVTAQGSSLGFNCAVGHHHFAHPAPRLRIIENHLPLLGPRLAAFAGEFRHRGSRRHLARHPQRRKTTHSIRLRRGNTGQKKAKKHDPSQIHGGMITHNRRVFHGKIRLAVSAPWCEKKAMTPEVESLRKTLHIYKGLVEVSGLINSITDYSELLRAILDVARRVILAEAASLFFVNEQTGELDLTITSFAEGQFLEPKISVPRGRGIAGWVAERGESLLIPDAYADDRFYKDADKQTGFRTRSILCAPLKRDGTVIGVLQILNPRDKQAFEEQDLDGFTAYANLTATAIDKLRNMERMRAQERVERDLAIASDIQSELLSRAIPAQIPGAVFAAHNQAASNVGGDFYNVFVKSPYEIYFAIGDVSGKGIAASLLMAQTLSAMQFVFAATTSPSDALAKLNSTLNDRIVRGMFVTTLVGRLTPIAGRIELASAGHCKPVLVRADGSAMEIETEGALPLGIMPKINYRQGKIDLEPGDMFVCYTDGLSESRNVADDSFFEAQIVPSLTGKNFSAPQNIIESLLQAERAHRGAGRQGDDLTILVGGLS